MLIFWNYLVAGLLELSKGAEKPVQYFVKCWWFAIPRKQKTFEADKAEVTMSLQWMAVPTWHKWKQLADWVRKQITTPSLL